VIAPASRETAKYRQSLIAAGGTDPIRTSRLIPPGVSGNKREDQNADQIEPTRHPRHCSAVSEYEGADEIKHQQKWT
jgi:hypothetical protein